MTLRDLLEKGEGQLYLVNTNSPTTVTEIDCVMTTQSDFVERYPMYKYWFIRWRYNNEYIIGRKSRAKNGVHRDGTPRFVNIFGTSFFLHPRQNDLDKTKYEFYKAIVFLSKEDACDYVINKVKKRKQELNAIITKINKFKFNVADGD